MAADGRRAEPGALARLLPAVYVKKRSAAQMGSISSLSGRPTVDEEMWTGRRAKITQERSAVGAPKHDRAQKNSGTTASIPRKGGRTAARYAVASGVGAFEKSFISAAKVRSSRGDQMEPVPTGKPA